MSIPTERINDYFNEASVSRYIQPGKTDARYFYLKGTLDRRGNRCWNLVKTNYPRLNVINRSFSSQVGGAIYIAGEDFLNLASAALDPTNHKKPVSGNRFFTYFARNKISNLEKGTAAQQKKAKTKRKLKSALIKSMKIGKGLKHSDEAVALHKNYWQEALSQKHTYGADLLEIHTTWAADKDTMLNFDDWLIEKGHIRPNAPAEVQYLTENERSQYEVNFRDGLLRTGELAIDTIQYQSINAIRPGLGIFVISSDGKMYIGPHEYKNMHHSSYLGGAAVIGAGEIRTDSTGKVIELTTKSGHYKPGKPQMLATLRYLKKNGVSLDGVKIVELGKEANKVYNDAAAYLKSEGSVREDGLNEVSYAYAPDNRTMTGLVVNDAMTYSRDIKQGWIREILRVKKISPESRIDILEPIRPNICLVYKLSDYIADKPLIPSGFTGGRIEQHNGISTIIIEKQPFEHENENKEWMYLLLATLARKGVIDDRSDLVFEGVKRRPDNAIQYLQSITPRA